MINFFSNMFGYVLNFIYSLVNNYGLAIILFSIILKIVLLPLSIKQQKTTKKTEKIQKESKIIQEKYKNNPEKMNKEIMDLYKRENISPFGGCFTAIIQLILILAMFTLVRNPITNMLHVDNAKIEAVTQYIKEESDENVINQTYPQISIIKYVANNKKEIEINTDGNTEKINLENLYINMDFVGIDLSQIPQQNYTDVKVYIIPVLYVISSVISIRISTNMKKKTKESIKEEYKKDKKEEETDLMTEMNKNMSLTMPFLAVMVSLVAPLGLALYWLTNNILMIAERIIIDKYLEKKGEKTTNA